jgi:creatinine amidohydrolase/Fe(II)-dependent formamide hydrolase-like protein
MGVPLTAAALFVALFAQTPAGQAPAAQPSGRNTELMTMARPVDALDTVFIEEMTWLEVRDALKAGKTTVIVPTGGVEPNGPYLATGKHNYVNRATCNAIARKLGDALCAPNVPFVPEGRIDPPSSHMMYPGTISLTDETFQALLTDIASSLKTHGFENIVLIGDSGGNQNGMKATAASLSAKWAGSKTRIHFVPEYYDYPAAAKWAEANLGWKQVNEGHHDDPVISSIMMTVDPETVRIKQRIAKQKATINGIALAPVDKAVAAGKRIVDYRADVTVAAIRKAIGQRLRPE